MQVRDWNSSYRCPCTSVLEKNADHRKESWFTLEQSLVGQQDCPGASLLSPRDYQRLGPPKRGAL